MKALIRSWSWTLLLACAMAAAGCDSDDPGADDGAVKADGGVSPDAKQPQPDSAGPLAKVYLNNPVADKKQTTQVTLTNITDKAGKLTGKWTNTWNCMPDPKGKKIDLTFSGMAIKGVICTLQQTAVPGKDGTYLQHKPPAKDTAGNDAFAELMMYHHVNTFHDHFTKTFGLTHLNKQSLKSVVNLQGYADMFGTWVGLPNAAFMPKESSQLLKQYGIDLFKDEDVIVFGYNNLVPGMGTVNFSYDASVIYHEYTHYSIGKALWMPAKDKYGLDPSPRGLNEALADYFASSYLNNPKLGDYALGTSARDLTRSFKCPDNIVGEEHRDGEIAAGALWAVRKLLTAKVADQAYWNAMLSFTATTNFDQAATAFLAELKKVATAAQLATVKKTWQDRGFLGCVRVVDHKDYAGSATVGPGYGGSGNAPSDFSDGVPGYMQYKLAVKDTTKEITIAYQPQGGGMFGVGGTLGDVSIALKPGDKPVVWDYASGKAKHDALKVIQGDKVGTPATSYKLVLSGDCIKKGTLIYQFISNDASGGGMASLKVTQSDTVTNSKDNFTGCTK